MNTEDIEISNEIFDYVYSGNWLDISPSSISYLIRINPKHTLYHLALLDIQFLVN